MDPSDDRDGATSAEEEGAWLVPASTPAAPPRRRRIRWLFLALAILGTVATIAFVPLALDRIRYDRSFDVPLPNAVRLGFHGPRRFSRWTCNDGHDHWSAPYWFGLTLLAVPTLFAWRAWARRRG